MRCLVEGFTVFVHYYNFNHHVIAYRMMQLHSALFCNHSAGQLERLRKRFFRDPDLVHELRDACIYTFDKAGW